MSSPIRCRSCGMLLQHTFVDLGMSPVSNANISSESSEAMEPFFPLHARVCNLCWLVQLPEIEKPQQIFKEDYAYFSSYSDSWLAHCRSYADQMVERCGLSSQSFVVEVASNDGYLLQYLVQKGVPVLGIEPSANVAEAARKKGVETLVKFFGEQTARDLKQDGYRADLIIGNNVLAHVPDILDFVRGLKVLLKADGVITLEFPHLLQMMNNNQFDTIYHEHFSYLSLLSVRKIFQSAGLRIFDVEELTTHGGSLRIFGCHQENGRFDGEPRVVAVLQKELKAGLASLEAYSRFSHQVCSTKRALLDLLIRIKAGGKKIAGYGAPAKGNTLLNYCGIRTDFIDYTVDKNPHKQGKLLPGTHIPVYAPERIMETRPDYVLILPWNIKGEVMEQMKGIRQWGGKFIVPIPNPEVL